MRFWQGLALAVAAAVMAFAAPEIGHFTPQAVVPGRGTVLTFTGSNLEGVSNLWTSFGGTARRLADTNGVRFEVFCPANARGVHELQLAGAGGVSPFQFVLVDAMRLQGHENKHRSPEAALRVAPPVAVDGVLKSEQIDYYTFTAKAGQEFSVEVIAHRLGSQMDPVARVLDARGRELAYCDDEPGVWKDARFVFAAPLDGDYTLAVHDIGYGGGGDYNYRLRVGSDPLVWYHTPLVKADEGAEAASAGDAAANSPANPLPGAVLGPVPALSEAEPNDRLPQALGTLGGPMILHGLLQHPGDVDAFRFAIAEKGKWIFRSFTRSLGSPCDLDLRLRKLDGALLAQSDGKLASDAALTNDFAEAGEYVLEVRDLSGQAPSRAPYRIELEPFQPGAVLTAEAHRFDAAPGGSVTVKMTCRRIEYAKPITVELAEPVEGLTLESNVIEGDKKEAEIKLKLAESLAPGALLHFRLVAKTEAGLVLSISTRPALRKAFPLMLNFPARLDGLFALGILKKTE